MVREPLMSGFPPPSESRVSLANWQDPPYNRWSFQHLRELIPTQRISRGPDPWRELPHRRSAPVLDDVTVHRLAGQASTFAEVIAESWTDAAVVLHDENENMKLDRNFLGVPKEGWGMSNNPKALAKAPEFGRARFVFDGDMTLRVSLNY